jgi:formylglycine-generating enzyme required for sulfatase activity
MGTNPSSFKGERNPVERVTWNDANSFCQQVGGRLPSEEEWEYAARGGTAEAHYGELNAIAWYGENSGGQTHAVMTKAANPFGLFDMLGNVHEWTASWYEHGSTRVLRGGSWSVYSRYARASVRNWNGPDGRLIILGFRCAADSL